MRLRIDEMLCQGHALCSFTAPDLFAVRHEDGHAEVVCGVVPPGLEAAARKASIGCPERAIVIQD